MAKILHTIGYEGASIEGLLATLKKSKVDLLIDVRDLPLSRKRGFSKNSLSGHLQASHISYLHLKGLGDPKPGRIAAREGRYRDFKRIFHAHLRSEAAQQHLKQGIAAAQDRSACLLCFEGNHELCHRCIVAEEMATRAGFRLVHLSIAGKPLKNAENPPHIG